MKTTELIRRLEELAIRFGDEDVKIEITDHYGDKVRWNIRQVDNIYGEVIIK